MREDAPQLGLTVTLRSEIFELKGSRAERACPRRGESERWRGAPTPQTNRGDSSSIHIYPDAGQAFFADYRPSYQQESAEDGWKRLNDWLKTHHAQ